MLPEVRETATGWAVTFVEDPEEPPYITFAADFVEQVSWGLITTLTISSPLAQGQHLPNDVVLLDRVNLMKSRDLYEVARRLDQRLPAPRSARGQDWQSHLEAVAVLVHEQMAKPVAHIELQEQPLPDRQRFLVPGLLARGKSNVIFGPGGTGKSVLATRIAASVVSGVDLFGLEVENPGRVLYLDWEDDEGTMIGRLEEVCKGMGIKRVPFTYKRLAGRGAYERHHADVKLWLDQNPTSLVIFDSVAMAMSGSNEGAEGAIKFFSLLDQLPTTRLLIDHIASDDVKDDDKKKGPPKKPYGSVFKQNSARNMWAVTPWNDQYVSGITLTHTKTNVTKKMAPMDISVEWNDRYVSFTRI